MACNGPFCRGSGGFCACNCNCCPPPYVESVSATFQCGSPLDPDDAPTGCDCVSAFRMRGAKKAINFPKFNNKPLTSTDNEFVFALQNVGDCSIPCTTTTVTLTTTGCGFELSGGNIYSVGSGTITATTNPSTGEGNCQNLVPKINGAANTYSAPDCELLTITVTGTDELCCPCCQVGLFSAITMEEEELPMRKTTRPQGFRLNVNKKAITKFRWKSSPTKTLPPTSP